MNIVRFSLFTGLGAGIWVTVLTAIGYGLGHAGGVEKTYKEFVIEGKDLIRHNLPWLLLGLAALFIAYVYIHRRVMHGAKKHEAPQGE